jgi:hypothetical protein
MSQDTYRIVSPSLYVFFENGHYVSGMLPKESLITIASETFKGDKLVEVLFKGKVVMMFTQDLRSPGEKSRITRSKLGHYPASQKADVSAARA